VAVQTLEPARWRGDAERVAGLLARLPAESEQRKALTARAHAWATACGCEASGILTSAALIAAIAAVVLGTPITAGSVLLGAAAVFGAGLVGKALGIGLARARLRLLRLRLERELGR
jgi:hypothetical protein